MKLLTSHLRIATPSPRGKLHFYLRALNSGQYDYSIGWLHRRIRVLHFFHSLQPDASFKAPKQIPRNLKPTPKQTFSPPTLLLHSASGSKKYQSKLASTSTPIRCHKGKVSGKYFVQILLGILTIHNLAFFYSSTTTRALPKTTHLAACWDRFTRSDTCSLFHYTSQNIFVFILVVVADSHSRIPVLQACHISASLPVPKKL